MPIITIFCPFTRHWAIERWIANLESLNLDYSKVNLVALIDCDEPRISWHLRRLDDRVKFRSFHIHMNREHNPTEVRVERRRIRIAEVMNQAKEYISKCDGDILVGLEDDTVFDAIDLKRLIEPLSEEVGFVEGVQCGRWGVKMVGAWRVDDIENPVKVETLVPSTGYEEISGGGYYGYACWKDLFLDYYHTWNGEPWGPDVNFGLYIRRKGYKCLIDWQTVFKHNDHNVLLDPLTGVAKVCYAKNITSGQWTRSDYEANPSS